MERKSFELYVQSAIWVGGIAAAASGGVLLALLNENMPASLIGWLRGIGGVLLVALGASVYVQLHAISVLSAIENGKEEPERRNRVRISQGVMIFAMLIASALLIAALVLFEPKPVAVPTWTVAGVSSTATESIVVLAKPESSTLRIVSRRNGEQTWRVDEVHLGSTVASPKEMAAAPR